MACGDSSQRTRPFAAGICNVQTRWSIREELSGRTTTEEQNNTIQAIHTHTIVWCRASDRFDPRSSPFFVFLTAWQQPLSFDNDYLLIGPSISKINSLKKKLAKANDIEDLGAAHYFLGVKIC